MIAFEAMFCATAVLYPRYSHPLYLVLIAALYTDNGGLISFI